MDGDELTGAGLARGFYRDVVAPILAGSFPGLRYAAARLGSGSDVLGLDDAVSRDHDWGCRLTLLVDSRDEAVIEPVSDLLRRQLPDRYQGRPVRFPVTWDAIEDHRVEVWTVSAFAGSRLGVDPAGGLDVYDWLSLTGQSVLEVTAGPVFADRTGELRPLLDLLLARITDPRVAALPRGIGCVERWADNVDVLSSPGRRAGLRPVYRVWSSGDC